MSVGTAREFTNLHLSEKELMSQKSLNKKGYFISKTHVVLIVFIIIVICVALILAMYYGHPDYGKTDVNGSQMTTAKLTTKLPGLMTTVTNVPTTAPRNIRLPTSLIPMHYNVRIRPDIYSNDPVNFINNGTVEITFKVHMPTNIIVLHWKAMTIDTANIKLYETSSMIDVPVHNDLVSMEPYPLELLDIPTVDMLVLNNTYTLRITYSGAISKDLIGIYYSNYDNDNGETVYLIASQLQVTDARKAFPCMDEPALKATFSVIIERQSTKTSKANMMFNHSEYLSDGWIADYFDETPLMSTYLLAFHVSDFQCVQNYTSSGKLVEFCVRPNAIQQVDYAMSLAIDMQEWYDWYYDIEYPLKKLTHVALPDFGGGGMENWGMINYREAPVLYDPKTASSSSFKTQVATFVSHELAHMWFGDLVTPAWWDDLWLNEGFAVYMGILVMHNTKDLSTWKMEDQYVTHQMHAILREDSLVTSHPIYVSINHPTEIGAIFDQITYYKGAAVVRMIKYFLGEHTFRWGISNYLKDRSYKAATHKYLFEFLSAQAMQDGVNVNVSAIVNTWILQMGYPVVTFDYTKGKNSISISQQHYLRNPTENVTRESPYEYIWMVPVSYMTDQSGVPDLNNLTLTWLNTPSGEILDVPTNLQWVIGNVGETFYYRVNYNKENWDALAQQLLTDHQIIPTMDRTKILNDAFNLARSGHLDLLTAFNQTQYIVNETEYTPWLAFFSNTGYIRKMLYQSSGGLFLQNYMDQKISPLYSTFGWTQTSENGTLLNELLRSVIIAQACSYRIKGCLKNANDTFQQWMSAKKQNQTYEISSNVALITYCFGISEGGITEWDFVYEMFLKSNSAAEKNSYLAALACSTVPWILQRYLEWTLAEDKYGIGTQNIVVVLPGVSKNPAGTHIAWNFFKANWDHFFERFGQAAFTLTAIITPMTENFSSEWELTDLENFMQQYPDQGTGERAFQQALESTRGNIKWRNNNEDKTVSWLAQS